MRLLLPNAAVARGVAIAAAVASAALASPAAFSAAAGSDPANMWIDDSRQLTRIDNLLVVALTTDGTLRRAFEDAMVAALGENGSKGIASYQVLPDAATGPDAIRAALRKGRYGGAMTIRVVGADRRDAFAPGYSYYVPPADLVPFHEGWSRGWETVSAPGYPGPDKVVRVEARVWQMAVDRDGQLVWVGTTPSYKAARFPKVARDACERIVSELGKPGVI